MWIGYGGLVLSASGSWVRGSKVPPLWVRPAQQSVGGGRLILEYQKSAATPTGRYAKAVVCPIGWVNTGARNQKMACV